MRNSVNFFGPGNNVNATERAIQAMNYALIEIRGELLNSLEWNAGHGRGRIAFNVAMEDSRLVNEAYLALNGRGTRVRRIANVENCINCCSANTRIMFNRQYKELMIND